MNEETEFKSKAELYRHHALRSKDFSGRIKDYCEKNNLDTRYFYHYRSEMGISSKVAKPKSFVKVVEKPDVKEFLNEEKEEVLSDAKWLAEFAHHYLNIQ